MTTLEQIKIKNQVEKILHVPGNYSGGTLEFAIVFDYACPKKELEITAKELITLLKSHSQVFLNARLNIIKWISDERIIKEVSSMGIVQMGRCFEDYVKGDAHKSYDELTRQLKMFYARSKLIIILTNNSYFIKNQEAVDKNLHPFLCRKQMKIQL